MLLVLRENERKFKATFKNEVEGLRVFEKTTANKQNRQGCIRRVNQIPAKKKKGKKSDDRLNDDSKEQQVKLNIFDEKDHAAFK